MAPDFSSPMIWCLRIFMWLRTIFRVSASPLTFAADSTTRGTLGVSNKDVRYLLLRALLGSWRIAHMTRPIFRGPGFRRPTTSILHC